MDGAPSSSSPPALEVVQPKYLIPSDSDGDDQPCGSGAQKTNGGGAAAANMILNVDSDCAEDDDCFDDQQPGPAPAPVSRDLIDGAIQRRSKDRQVKMSIGNYDEFDEDSEDNEEDKRARLREGLRNIRQKKQEAFVLESPPESEAMRQFINAEVNSAMMFNQANSNIQHIDYDPLAKRKTPKIVEGYLWGACIGNGSYGKVKEVMDVYTLTRRAVKIMKYDKLRKITNGWENIRCEMSILRRLNHKNVIKLVEIFNIPAKGKVYMVFEYCIGSVQQIIDLEPARRLTIGESHAIFVELLHGLNYLHSKRVSHKDIKPGNLLLSIDLTVKICDFGVAEQLSLFQEDGRCTKVNGTPKFQPPECVWGSNDSFDFSGYKADIWGAGVTLYNLVSGMYPFEKPVLLKLYESIGTDPLEMPTNVPISKDLHDLLINLLEKDYEKRFTCLEVMTHPWFISTFPEDQGLGRVMERMRTGDRPFTMMPSLTAMFDGPQEEMYIEEDGTYAQPNFLVCGGFKYLEPQPGDATVNKSETAAAAVRRPSSRSMPTAPPPVPSARVSPAPPLQQEVEEEVVAPPSEAPPPPPIVVDEQPRRRRGKRGFFSCIFRSRTDSN